MVEGLQQLVAQDDESVGHVGAGGGATNHGAVLGSGDAKRVAEPGDYLAGGGRGRGVMGEGTEEEEGEDEVITILGPM